jgi:hypothetical protein
MGGELFEQKATAIPVRKGGEVHHLNQTCQQLPSDRQE